MLRSSQQLSVRTVMLCVVSLATFAAPLPTLAQQPAPAGSNALTLSQAVDVALSENPLTKAAAANRKLADAQLKEARAGRKPLLQVSETFTNSNNPVFVFGSLLEQGRFTANNFNLNSLNQPDPLSNFRSAVTLRMPVFDQLQTRTRVKQALIETQIAERKTEQIEQTLRFEVLRAYYNVLLSEARLAVTDEAVKTGEADVKRTRDRFETGLVVRSDLLAAEVQLAEFLQQRIEADGALATAFAALNTTLGLPVATPQTLSAQLIERNFTPESVEALITQALENRPEYQEALLSVSSRAEQVRGARGEWLPRVDAFGTAGASSHYLVNGSSDYAVGASVTFNVFDAGRKARIEEARAGESVAKANAEQLANQIRFEVARAYHQYISARQRLAVVAQVSAQAAETLRIVQDRYNAGLTNITELLRAETALLRARTDVLAARYDHYIGYASMLLAAGRLKDVSDFGG